MINTIKNNNNGRKGKNFNLSKGEVYALLNKARIPENSDEYSIHSDDGLVLGGYDINEQKESLEIMKKHDIEDIELLPYKYIAIKKGGKRGVINKKSERIIEPKFNSISYGNGLFIVKSEDGKYGFIDIKGRQVIDNIFKHIAYHEEGIYKVENEDGKWGIIDLKSKERIIKAKFKTINSFDEEGRACAQINDGKRGIINEKGERIILPKYFDIKGFNENGLAVVKYKEERDKIIYNEGYNELGEKYDNFYQRPEWGIINEKGEEILDIKFQFLGKFDKEGRAHAKVDKNNETKFIDGEVRYKGLRCGDTSVVGFVDEAGARVIGPKESDTESINSFNENGLTVAKKKGGKWGIINEELEWIVEPKYEDIQSMSLYKGKDSIPVKNEDGKWGTIDKTGKRIIMPKFEYISFFDEKGIALARNKDRKCGIIDEKGERIIKPNFKTINSFDERGRAWAQNEDGKYGVINEKGERIINPEFLELEISGHLISATVKNENNKYGVIDEEGNQIIECKYDKVVYYSSGKHFRGLRDGKIYEILRNGDEKEIVI